MRRVSLARAAIVLTVVAGGIGISGGIAFAAPAPSPVNVTCGDVISTSITVANDLTCAGGVALSVQDSGVTLDLGGHTISGNSTAGVYFNGGPGAVSGQMPISVIASDNTAGFNGTNPDGTLDPAGMPVVGGIYLYTPAGGNTFTDNTTSHNGGFGIYALPPNTFSGNVSNHDAANCFPLNLCTYK